MNTEYLSILLLMLCLAWLSEHKFHVHLYHNRKERFEIVSLFFIVGIIWDSFAIWRGHWAFPPGKTLGFIIGLMPVEEYLFALIIPYFVITLYKILDAKFEVSPKGKLQKKRKQ